MKRNWSQFGFSIFAVLLSGIGKVDSVAYNFTFAYLVHGTFDTKQFWGVNIRFQAKLAKSKNVRIIKTTASISFLPGECVWHMGTLGRNKAWQNSFVIL